jgi:hypothetical protein
MNNEPGTGHFNPSLLWTFAAAVAAQLLTGGAAFATPYASCLTNNAGVISFRLNEAADNVKLILSGGATTNDLGPVGKGLTITNIGIAGTFKVQVTKTSGAGWMQGAPLQISSDSDRVVQFEQPVGVAVNRNPASPYFGRVYVSNSRSLATGTGRTATEGIFVLTPDLTDALEQGDAGLTGGITFETGYYNASSPWKLEVGQDDNLYISDFNTNSGTLWVTDPNVSSGSGKNVLDGMGTPFVSPTASMTHGQIASSAIVLGSLATSDLTVYLLDSDIPTKNGVHRFDVSAGPLPSTVTPVDLLDPISPPLLQASRVIVDLDRAQDGKFYLTQYRDAGNETGLAVVSNQDTNQDSYLDVIYSSLDDWRSITNDPSAVDYMRHSYAVKRSPVGDYLAVATVDGPTFILPLDANGLPVLTNRMTLATASAGPTRDVCFDAAGNLYIVNNSIELLRAFSPGGRWVATSGSDGTFSIEQPAGSVPEVTISSVQTNMYERVAADSGSFSVVRIGDTTKDLTVNLALGGTAVNGVDYGNVPASIVIPAGAVSVSQTLTPIDNTQFTGDKTILVSVAPGTGYNVVDTGGPAAIRIQDDETDPGPVLFSDDFEADSSANWTVRFGAGNGIDDYTAEFAYDYGLDGIPPAPHSAAGTTKGVRLKVNKDTTGSAAAVNLYPTGKTFSGDFALRADAYMSIGTDAGGQTEHTIFGINCTGTTVNRHGVSGTDGLWFAVDTDGSNNRGYGFYGTSSSTTPTLVLNNSAFSWAFTSPPYGFAGAPGNTTNATTLTGSGYIWADVQVRQVGGVVTMKVNNTTIFEFANTYAYTSGTIMIGQNDEFASIGSPDNYTIWDNVRVIELTPQDRSIMVTGIKVSGTDVVIDFTTPAPGVFNALAAATVNGQYDPDPAAVVTSTGANTYRATAPISGPVRFYRISRAP